MQVLAFLPVEDVSYGFNLIILKKYPSELSDLMSYVKKIILVILNALDFRLRCGIYTKESNKICPGPTIMLSHGILGSSRMLGIIYHWLK